MIKRSSFIAGIVLALVAGVGVGWEVGHSSPAAHVVVVATEAPAPAEVAWSVSEKMPPECNSLSSKIITQFSKYYLAIACSSADGLTGVETTPRGGDGSIGEVLLFAHDRFVAATETGEGGGVQVLRNGFVVESLHERHDNDSECCPTGDHALAVYRWDGATLTPYLGATSRVSYAQGTTVAEAIDRARTSPTPAPAIFIPAPSLETAPPATAAPDAAQRSVVTTHFDNEGNAVAACSDDIVVWVNPNSGVFHFRGQRYYDNTEAGYYECERGALDEGDRPTRNGQ